MAFIFSFSLSFAVLFYLLCLSLFRPFENGNHNSFSGISHFHNTWVLSVTTNLIATSTVYYEYELDWVDQIHRFQKKKRNTNILYVCVCKANIYLDSDMTATALCFVSFNMRVIYVLIY